MRFCENETVDVYEATGRDLAVLLEDAAATVREANGGYSFVTTAYDNELGYILTLYVSG